MTTEHKFQVYRSGPSCPTAQVQIRHDGHVSVVLTVPSGYGRTLRHEIGPSTAVQIIKVLSAAVPDINTALGRGDRANG